MKIALLQEAFCLVGFSGDDPNFINWVSWVRSVLHKRALRDNNKTRLFFIDVSGNPLSAERNQLFSNNGIEHISLLDAPDKSKDKRIIKEKLEDFFNKISFVSEDERTKIDDVNNYNKAWLEIKVSFKPQQNTNRTDLVINSKSADVLWETLKYNRIPKLDSYAHRQRESVFRNITQLITTKKINKEVAKIIFAAISGEMMPINIVINYQKNNGEQSLYEQFLTQISQYPDIVEAFNKLDNRARVLFNEKPRRLSEDSYQYDFILNKTFNLDFQETKNLLQQWEPEEMYWKIKKLALLSLIDNKLDQEKVNQCLVRDNYNCDQEYIYGIDIITRIRNLIFCNSNDEISFDLDIKKERDLVLQQYPELNRVWDNIEYLRKMISSSKIDVTPYGNTSNKIVFGERDSLLIYSIQLLQTILEIGIPLQTRSTIFFDKDDWYAAFKNIFEIYPYPSLYISLQYGGDNSYMKRIAQDYIFSCKIKRAIPDLLCKMLIAIQIEETPENIKEGILTVAQIFMKCVDSKKWGRYFVDIYNRFSFSNDDINRVRLDPIYNFFLTGVELIKDSPFKMKVLNDSLSQFDKIDNYYNSLIIAASKEINTPFTPDIIDLLDGLISDAEKPAQFYVLINLRNGLKKDQIDKLIDKMSQYDFLSCNESTMFYAASMISKTNTDFQNKLRSSIIGSQLLWRTGIKNEAGRWEVSSYSDPGININNIQENLNFGDDELNAIYDKLKSATQEITNYVFHNKENLFWGNLVNWKNLLLQMKSFLVKNKKKLSKNLDFNDILSNIEKIYKSERGGNSIIDAIFSDDASIVRNGIENLVYEIGLFGVKKFQNEYIAIANRIIFKNNEGLNSCLKHFSWSLTKYKNEFDFNCFKPLLKRILNTYSPYFKKRNSVSWKIYAEKDVAEQSMIAIYKVYESWNGKDDFWKKYKSIFYN